MTRDLRQTVSHEGSHSRMKGTRRRKQTFAAPVRPVVKTGRYEQYATRVGRSFCQPVSPCLWRSTGHRRFGTCGPLKTPPLPTLWRSLRPCERMAGWKDAVWRNG